MRGDDSNLHSLVGTPLFVAPEVYLKTYDEKVDVFSTGLVFLTVIERCHLPSGHFGLAVPNSDGSLWVVTTFPCFLLHASSFFSALFPFAKLLAFEGKRTEQCGKTHTAVGHLTF